MEMSLIEALAGLGAVGIAALALVWVARMFPTLAKMLSERSSATPSMAEAIKELAGSISTMTIAANQERADFKEAITLMSGGFELLRAVIEKHEAEEERRENQQIDRHQKMLDAISLLVGTIKDTPGDVKTAIAKIDKLGERMETHSAQRPEILNELQAIRQTVEGMEAQLNQLDGKVDTFISTTKSDVETLRQDLSAVKNKTTEVEKTITSERPAATPEQSDNEGEES